jgi:integrase
MAGEKSKVLGRLSARKVETLKTAGYHHDGGGLYLRVTASGSRSWLFRYATNGGEHWVGLGSAAIVPLADARIAAAEFRLLRQKGRDPIAEKRAAKVTARGEAAKAITFEKCADDFIDAHGAEWRNEKHKKQWRATLSTYAFPMIGDLPVGSVDTNLVVDVLKPIWTTKTETAMRLRGRIESILDYAKVRDYRSGDNPARLRGNLEIILGKPSKLKKVEHHPAMPFKDVGTFMPVLRAQSGAAAKALEFTILNVARTGETIGCRWPEIDLVAKVWTVPGERMKAGKTHRVPLTPAAIAVLEVMKAERTAEDSFVFPGATWTGKGLSNMAMAKVLERLGHGSITVHGFRSCFRDWASAFGNFDNEVVERCLAHAVKDKTEAAYFRDDLLDKRRRVLVAWAEWCSKPFAAAADVAGDRSEAAE